MAILQPVDYQYRTPERDDHLEPLYAKAQTGERLSVEEGLTLFEEGNLLRLASAAHQRRLAMAPAELVTFVLDRNINYTNFCVTDCKFCNFYRRLSSEEGYVLSHDEIFRKIEELKELGGTQILLQGGHNPRLKLEYYTDLLRAIHERFEIIVHGFSAPEIHFIAEISHLPVREVARALREAGLGAVPGAGAEILVDEVRDIIAPKKISAADWLATMEACHEEGLRSSATMMYSPYNTPRHIMEHLDKIRVLQDKTGGFMAFIPWNFQPEGTELGGAKLSSYTYLRVMALSRLMLDNVANFQVSWVTNGPQVAQIALSFGANDFGNLMMEENVVSAAGTAYCVGREDMIHLIRDAGYTPAQRDTYYRVLRTFGEADGKPEGAKASPA